MKIPDQLKDWRFVLIATGTKRPIEDGWTKDKNYAHDDPKLQKHIENGGSYGVLCGRGHIVVDADTDEILNLVEKNLPQTFAVRTPHGGVHFYFNCDLGAPLRLRDKDGKNVGDIQGEGKQVVGPGCIVDGKTYEIIKNWSVTPISEKKLCDVFSDHIAKRTFELSDEEIQRAKEAGIEQEISITDVVPLEGLKRQGDEYFGPHPVHGSDTGRNFWVNPKKNVWSCFRHSSGGGPFSWLAVQEGVINCEDAIPGALRGEKFAVILEKAQAKGLIKLKDSRLEKVEVTERIERLVRDNKFFDKFLESTGRRVKHDLSMRELLILTGISAYSDDPLNVFLKGPTSTGKTFPATNVMNYFPTRDVWMLAGLSPTALVHGYGEWDGDNKRFVVDITSKILVFLEAPQMQTYQMLRPLLSHDQWEMNYKFTDKTKKGQLRTTTVTLRGWPACVFCSSDATYIADLATRGITHTPEMKPEKWKDANIRRGLEVSRPWALVTEKREKKLIQDTIKVLKNKIIERKIGVVIPYGEDLAQVYTATVARDMRDFPRLLSLIKQSALLHCYQRPYLEIGEERLVIATERDYEVGGNLFMDIIETTQIGIPGDVLQFFFRVLSLKDEWSYVEAQTEGRKQMNIRVGGKRFKERYIYPLFDVGLAIKVPDPYDKRRSLVQVEKRRDWEKSKLPPFREFFPEEKAKKWLINSQNYVAAGGVSPLLMGPSDTTYPISFHISLIFNGLKEGVLEIKPRNEEKTENRRTSAQLEGITVSRYIICEFITDHPRSVFLDPDTDQPLELGPFGRGDTRGIPAQFAHALEKHGIVKIKESEQQQPAPSRRVEGV